MRLSLYLVKNFHSCVDDLQLEELLRQVLHPEVNGSGIQAVQEEKGQAKHDHTEHIRELLPLQPHLPAAPPLVEGPHVVQRPHESYGQDCEDCLHGTANAMSVNLFQTCRQQYPHPSLHSDVEMLYVVAGCFQGQQLFYLGNGRFLHATEAHQEGIAAQHDGKPDKPLQLIGNIRNGIVPAYGRSRLARI